MKTAPHSQTVASDLPEVCPPIHDWTKRPKLVSIVCPVFREELGLCRFCDELVAEMHRLGVPFEIIFVEDDSPDRSWDVVEMCAMKYPGLVKGLSLSRRFGHQASLAAGYAASAGDAVICMDSDLQHPPAMLPRMLWLWSQGWQIVYTRRRRQEGRGVLKELASRWFYRWINRVAEVRFEEGTADFRLMDRAVIEAVNRLAENRPLFRGLVSWMGFRRIAIEYDAPERFAGTSSYTWRRMLKMGMDGLFAFSLAPLRMCYGIGAAALIGFLVYAIYVVIVWLDGGSTVPGYTSLSLLIMFMGGVQLICLGILGEYIGRVHEQVKGRPLYLVKSVVGFGTVTTENTPTLRMRA